MDNEKQYLKDAGDAAFHWYQQADTKAQVLLGFSGVFLSIILASLFSLKDATAIASIKEFIEILVAVMIGHLTAMSLSVYALWSRGIFFDRNKAINFFGRIANYSSSEELHKSIKATTEQELLSQATANLFILSRNTRFKHRIVDIAAAVSSLSLLGTVLAAVLIVTGIDGSDNKSLNPTPASDATFRGSRLGGAG